MHRLRLCLALGRQLLRAFAALPPSMAVVVALTASAASGQVSLNSVRVVAKNSETLAKFYAAAFGMQETNRLQTQNGPEVFLTRPRAPTRARPSSSCRPRKGLRTIR
jgi:hypothetical protein